MKQISKKWLRINMFLCVIYPVLKETIFRNVIYYITFNDAKIMLSNTTLFDDKWILKGRRLYNYMQQQFLHV